MTNTSVYSTEYGNYPAVKRSFPSGKLTQDCVRGSRFIPAHKGRTPATTTTEHTATRKQTLASSRSTLAKASGPKRTKHFLATQKDTDKDIDSPAAPVMLVSHPFRARSMGGRRLSSSIRAIRNK